MHTIPQSPETQYQALEVAAAGANRRDSRIRAGVGLGWGLATLATVYGMSQMHDSDARIEHEMPYVAAAQDFVSNLDEGLKVIGEVGLPLSLGCIAAVKLGSLKNPRLRSMDRLSSKEMPYSGKPANIARRGLEKAAAGGVPLVATAGVTLGTLITGIGTEVTEGPTRPIEAIGDAIPGDQMITQYAEAMPMTESTVSKPLADAVRQIAASRNVKVTPIDLHLGVLRHDGDYMTSLALGMNMPEGSPLDWRPAEGCTLIPVAVDESARIAVGSTVEVSGVKAVVKDTLSDASAMNRIAVQADKEALQTCIDQNPAAGDHALILDTDKGTAHDILADAQNQLNAPVPATVIDKERYKQNSETFWRANGEPVTNLTALISTGLALVAMGGAMSARLLRSRREWASMLHAGVSQNHLRATELLRSAKDGIVAGVGGTAMAVPFTYAVNMLEVGFRVGIGYKEVMAGFAVSLLGSIGGGLARLIRPAKAIKPSEALRS